MLISKKLGEVIFRLFGGLFRPALNKTKVFGLENLPEAGFLLLPNKMIGREAVLLQLACPRPIRYIVDESIYRRVPLNQFFRSKGSIALPSVRTEDAACEASNRIRRGDIVCLMPEVEVSRSKTPIQLYEEYEKIANLSEHPVVPVWLDRAAMPMLLTKIKQPARGLDRFSMPTSIAFGKPIPKDEFSLGLARDRLLELGEFCFEKHPSLKEHLGRATIRGLWKNQFREVIIDGIDHR